MFISMLNMNSYPVFIGWIKIDLSYPGGDSCVMSFFTAESNKNIVSLLPPVYILPEAPLFGFVDMS